MLNLNPLLAMMSIQQNYNYRPIDDTALNNKNFIYDLNSYNKKYNEWKYII